MLCDETYEEDTEELGDTADALCTLTVPGIFPLQLGCTESNYLGEHRDKVMKSKSLKKWQVWNYGCYFYLVNLRTLMGGTGLSIDGNSFPDKLFAITC